MVKTEVADIDPQLSIQANAMPAVPCPRIPHGSQNQYCSKHISPLSVEDRLNSALNR